MTIIYDTVIAFNQHYTLFALPDFKAGLLRSRCITAWHDKTVYPFSTEE